MRLLSVLVLTLAALACNKTSHAPGPQQVAVAEAPAAPGAAAAPATASAESSAAAAGALTADAPAKPACGPDCACKDPAACAAGKCEGCAGKKCEGCAGKCEGCAGGKNAEGAACKCAGCAAKKAGEAGACGGAAGASADGEAAAASACGGVKAEPAVEAAPAGPQHFGGAFTLADGAKPIDDVLGKAAELDGQNVRVSATITKVCKKKGCWFVLASEKDPATTVRVTMKDYGFFVPLDCDGKKADVEGVLKRVEVPEAARKHLAEDGKEDPNAIKGAAFELSLVATAIDLRP